MPPISLLGTAFTGAKALGSMFGMFGDSSLERKVDPFTQQANQENQQQKSLLYSNLQNEIGGSLRARQRDATNLATTSLGNQSNFGLSGNSMTAGALKSMAGANGMNTLLDQSAKAYGNYAQGMQQTNDFTRQLASDVNLVDRPGSITDKTGSLLKNLPQWMLDSETQNKILKDTNS